MEWQIFNTKTNCFCRVLKGRIQETSPEKFPGIPMKGEPETETEPPNNSGHISDTSLIPEPNNPPPVHEPKEESAGNPFWNF